MSNWIGGSLRVIRFLLVSGTQSLTDCQDGAANGAGPSECTAGVTPAPSENLGQDD